MCEVNGFVMVHSGRPLLDGDDTVLRNEGFDIVMYHDVAAVRRNSGECMLEGSRIVYMLD